jgi:hypothetical protein
MKTDGVLAKAYGTWMKLTPPTFPDAIEGIPFVAS